MSTTAVFCGNMPKGTTSQEVLDLFKPFGTIKEHNLVKTYAFIDFEQLEDAEKAVKALSGTDMGGRPLTVQISKKKEKGDGDGGNKRGSDRRDRGDDRRERDRRDRGDRRDRDRRGNGPDNRGVQIPGMMPGLDTMAVLGALTGQLQMQPPQAMNVGHRDIGPGPTPLNDAVVIYERFFVDPNHPLLKGLPLPRIASR